MARIIGKARADRLYGTDGYDHIEGRGGDDRLWGGEGNDTLVGGAGNDSLVGGMGTDHLTGGTGADTFFFGWQTDARNMPIGVDGGIWFKADVISDFEVGVDKISLEGYENPYLLGAKWIGQNDPDLQDAQLQVGYRWEGRHTIVEVYAEAHPPGPGYDQSPQATVEIKLYGHHRLSPDDFWL